MPPPDSQSDKKRRKASDELSRSLCLKRRTDQDDPNALDLKTPLVGKECPAASFGTQLLNLKELV